MKVPVGSWAGSTGIAGHLSSTIPPRPANWGYVVSRLVGETLADVKHALGTFHFVKRPFGCEWGARMAEIDCCPCRLFGLFAAKYQLYVLLARGRSPDLHDGQGHPWRLSYHRTMEDGSMTKDPSMGAQSTGTDASILSSQAVCLAWIESALPMNGVEIRLLKCNGEKEKWRWVRPPPALH